MQEIIIPQRLEPVVKAFFAESPKVAKELIKQAVKAIYEADNMFPILRSIPVTTDEIDIVCALMDSIKPKDALEAIFAAQIISTYMLGMRKLAKGNREDQRLGLNLLRFSNDAMKQLQRKRGGTCQNITVNHNYSSQGASFTQTIINDTQKEA